MLDLFRYGRAVWLTIWCVSVLLVCVTPLMADDSVSEPVELTLEQRLETKVSLDMTDQPLRSVIGELGTQCGLNFQLDRRGMEDLGFSCDEPVSVRFYDLPLRLALKIVLHELDLDWVVRQEMIHVTTAGRADSYLTPRVYSVTDLAYAQNDYGRSFADFDALFDLIQTTVVPECWLDNGGACSISAMERDGKCLFVVRSSPNVHWQLEQLLAELRRMGDPDSTQEPTAWQTRDEKVAEQMSRRLDIDLKNMLLTEFLEQVEREIGMPFIVDERALDEMGIMIDDVILNLVEFVDADDRAWGLEFGDAIDGNPFASDESSDAWGSSIDDDDSIRFDPPLKEVAIGTVLDAVLGELELVWLPDEHFIWITTEEMAGHYASTVRLYDVTDLSPNEDMEYSLAGVIESSVRPESWLDNGGPGSMRAIAVGRRMVLVVRQMWGVQTELEQLLVELRAGFDGSPDPPEGAVSAPPRGRYGQPMGYGVPNAVAMDPRISPELELDVSADLLGETVDGNNRLAMTLYDRLLDEEPVVGVDSRNLFYSPYSIASAIGMAYMGARSETADQIADVMQFPAGPEEQAELLASLAQRIEATGVDVSMPHMRPHGMFSVPGDGVMVPGGLLPQFEGGFGEDDGFGDGGFGGPGHMQPVPSVVECPIQISNAFWHDPTVPFHKSYIDDVERYFGGETAPLDFCDPALAAGVINGWVNDRTNGLIPMIVRPDDFSDDTCLMLVNTVYFDAEWAVPFERSATKTQPFFGLDSKQLLKIPLMMDEGHYGYAEVDGVQVVEKGYKHQDFSMVFMLPPEGEDAWREFESQLDDEFVDRANGAMGSRLVELFVPRFEMDCKLFGLGSTLFDLGMPIAFDDVNADFSGIADVLPPIYLERVMHHAVLRVNEERTVAAAVTGAGFGGGMMMEPPKPVTVRLDRPFVLMIRHNPSGTILFVGRVMKPVPCSS